MVVLSKWMVHRLYWFEVDKDHLLVNPKLNDFFGYLWNGVHEEFTNSLFLWVTASKIGFINVPVGPGELQCIYLCSTDFTVSMQFI